MLVPLKDVNYDDVLWLNRIVFDGYEFPTAANIEKIKEIDPRIPPEFAWYAQEDGRPVSQVGYLVYDINTRTGAKKAGVPYAVATLPEYQRRGFGTLVMEKVHSRIIELGCEYSFLSTSRRWLAHNWYLRNGYIDLARLDMIYGKIEDSSDNISNFSFRDFEEADESTLSSIFNQAFAELFGFNQRKEKFVLQRKIWADKHFSMKVLEQDGNIVGYANLVGSNPKELTEIAVLPDQDLKEWAQFLCKGTDFMTSLSPHQNTELRTMKGVRYAKCDATMMVKDLTGKMNSDEVLHDLGMDTGQFVALSFDRW